MNSSGGFPAIWCIGRNYADHAAELGNERPERPMVFMKNPASVIGDGDSIVIPEICRFPRPQVDWEAELGVVVGRDARDLGVEEAMDCVSHYRIANDVTARWWQKEGSGGQFCRGKELRHLLPGRSRGSRERHRRPSSPVHRDAAQRRGRPVVEHVGHALHDRGAPGGVDPRHDVAEGDAVAHRNAGRRRRGDVAAAISRRGRCRGDRDRGAGVPSESRRGHVAEVIPTGDPRGRFNLLEPRRVRFRHRGGIERCAGWPSSRREQPHAGSPLQWRSSSNWARTDSGRRRTANRCAGRSGT